MDYVSQPMSLEFWHRLQGRLKAEFQAKKQALAVLLQPIPATVDTAALALDQAAANRKQVLIELGRLENLQLLSQAIAHQIQRVAMEVGINSYELRLETMRNLAEVYTTHLCGLPSRLAPEQDIRLAAEQYAALRVGGSAEAAMTERARLRALTRDIRVMGAEDAGAYESSVRSSQTTIDNWDAELQSLRVSTQVQLRLDDSLAQLLVEFGVQVEEVVPPPVEAPVDTAEPPAPAAVPETAEAQ